ncbi:SEC-C metal-binding domain-containing protein [Fictibacillus sp. NPDC058756]|uniref:SEC-C metal-binding domain-containing protein n=1 Tax=Fictibacillus sp. NPDC058756 TaxID=3346625 RepID=UPI0036ABDB53
MSGLGRNDICPCGSGKKYKKCHGILGRLSDLSKDPFLKCVCGSDSHPYDCCGSFLASSRRIKSSFNNNEFIVENRVNEEYSGHVYFAIMSGTFL